jgi:hypothetical protein
LRRIILVFANTEDGELDQGATRANFARVQTEGDRKVTRNVPHFNLDAIISVGYRVNSKRGVKFRQWATKTLNDHLVHGYTLNQRRLAERGVLEAQQAMDLLARTLSRQESLTDESRQVLDLVTSYAKTWKTLLQYDENALSIPEGTLQNGRTTYGLGRVDAQRVGGRSFRRPRHTERVVHGDVRARAAACERSG